MNQSLLGGIAFIGLAAGYSMGAPLVSGNFAIADQIIHGDAHLMVIGDSIQGSYMLGDYLKYWQVDRVVGQVIGPNFAGGVGNTNSGGEIFSLTPGYVQSNIRYTPDQVAPDYNGISPGATQHITFKSQSFAAGTDSLNQRFFSAWMNGNQANYYAGGSWLYANNGNVNIDILTYNNPNGVTGAEAVVRVLSPNQEALGRYSISTNAAVAQPGITSIQVHSDNATAASGLNIDFGMPGGSSTTAGQNFILSGIRISTGQTGFQLANVSQGSKTIDHFLSKDTVTDENLAAYIAGTDSNIAYIWLGQNGNFAADVYKTKIEQLIDRLKTARSDMQFVLVSTHDTGNAQLLGAYADALSEIAESRNDTLFLNLFESAGNYAYLNANYLSDHVHPSQAGQEYFAQTVWNLILTADASVPEPGSLSILGLAGMGLLARRRKA